MARSIHIKITCDMCGDETDDQQQTTLRLDRREVLLDLCEAHKEELKSTLVEYLDKGVRQRKPGVASPAPTGEREACRICGRSFIDREGIRKHLNRAHGMTLSAYDAGETPSIKDEPAPPPVSAERPHQCPECGGGYQNPQGLAAHRRITHGVVGKSARQTA